ncbi:hypothetical protein J1N35_015671 [Gossypium stocksii]|uniref:Alpha-1,3-mannosyl-glycoprotein 2-beta-N-acetylglucosaminyltransferase n=1 Tax=Gossypium stocksii TaxID=47602 RepID=A0A9D4AA35_9ROSI|nr:hypothetical protein J1N35_015671 [Gossypium stocksii]
MVKSSSCMIHMHLTAQIFFPGLGWMLTRYTWDELSPKWPKAYPSWFRKLPFNFCITPMQIYNLTYWDEWLRLEENHKGRQFLRPEVCRTYNFSQNGSSMGQFFQQYVEPIKMNDAKVNWKSQDLSYLMEERSDKYKKYFADILKKAKPIHETDDVPRIHCATIWSF